MSGMTIPTLYRIVQSASPTAEDFMSTMMRGRPPERRDRQHPGEWAGLSLFDNAAQARRMAQRFPALGAWMATVSLDPRRAVVRQTFGEGHHTVWCHPTAGLDAIVAVEPIDQGEG